jgi:hypothetical protein
MATSYGYVERNLENDVNWGAVGKGFSDMLIAERDERTAKKKSLDDVMMETQEGISKNAPLGYNTDFNDRMIDFASNSSAFVLAANKDLKSGRITPEEYMRKLQRINSSADTVFGLANNFNEWYDDKLKRMDSKESGVVEQATFEIMSKLVDFNKHDFFIDKSGMVVAAPLIKGEDGITRPDTENARSVQAIFNLAQNTVNRVDVDKTIQEKIKLLGKRVVSREVAASYAAKGEQVTLEGLRYTDPDEYDKWKRAIIKEMTASDLDVASILGDYADEYEITGDAKTYDKNTQILLDLSEGKEVKVSLTENQKDRAFQVLSDAIDAQAGGSDIRKEIAKLEMSASDKAYYRDVAEGDKKNISDLNMVGKFYSGKTKADYDDATTYFKGLNPNITNIKREDDKLTVSFYDPKTQTTRFEYIPLGNSFEEFVKSATLLTKIKDVGSAMKRLDKAGLEWSSEEKKYIKTNAGVSSNATEFKNNSTQTVPYKDYINSTLKTNFQPGDFNPEFGKLGYTIDGKKGTSEFILKINGKEQPGSFTREQLRNYFRRNTTLENKYKTLMQNTPAGGKYMG